MPVLVIIPAFNEAKHVGRVVKDALSYADEVILIDDGSTEQTPEVAAEAGARVIRQANVGYVAAIKRGLHEAKHEIVVTMDADGEHRPDDIPRLMAPILAGEADLVLGARSQIARFSERFLNRLTRLRVRGVSDTGTGFRAMRWNLATQLELQGRCICGISVLESVALGARVTEVPIELAYVDKPRHIAWFHVPQIWYVLCWIIRPAKKEDQ